MLKHIQVGIIAYRNPETQEFMPSKPLYKLETQELMQQQEFLQKAFKSMVAVGLIEYINANTTKPTLEGREQKKEL